MLATKSARIFLGYCALINLLRRNVRSFTEPTCVALITVPRHWRLADVQEAAKVIFKDEKRVRFCIHPEAKHKRGWEIDTAEHLESNTLLIFAREGAPVHEDFELAATLSDRLILGTNRHLQAVGRLRGCGELSQELYPLIAEQPSERMDAIFRMGQPVKRAAVRLLEENKQRQPSKEVKRLDISKGFGDASVWAQELKKDIQCWFPRGTEPVGVRTKTLTTKEVVHVSLRRQTSSR
jgi:cell division protease FtsH